MRRPTRRVTNSLREMRFSIVRTLRLKTKAASRLETRILGTSVGSLMRRRIRMSAHRTSDETPYFFETKMSDSLHHSLEPPFAALHQHVLVELACFLCLVCLSVE